ncbi:MAG: sortase [Frankiales bacterium]|jgi:sortase A|nr:sortase [Frankiales bacterium]
MTEVTEVEPAAPPRRTVGDVVRLVVSGVGQLLITAGVILLLFVGYELWFTGIYTRQQQQTAEKAIQQTFTAARAPASGSSQAPPVTHNKNGDVVYPKVATGSAETILYVPRLGKNYHYVVVEGVGTDDLKKGPGHYPGTSLPGQLGNVVVSGHRTTYLAPFNRFDELKPGDPVIFEMADGWYTYKVVSTEIVQPTATWVIDNPYPDKRPVGRSFTFTTCNPKYSAKQRLVVYGSFVSHTPFSQPPAGINVVKGG